MGLGKAIGKITDPAYAALTNIGCPTFIASLLCSKVAGNERQEHACDGNAAHRLYC